MKSERQTFPMSAARQLATGAASQAFKMASPVAGVRFQTRIESVECGRPWAVERIRLRVDYADGIGAGDSVVIDVGGLDTGIDHSKPPSKVAGWADARNVSFQGGWPRSRRGFDVVNNESTTVVGKPSGSWDATNAAGEAWHLVMIAGTLYYLDGSDLISVDTDWPQDELPTVATVGLKTFIATRSKVRVFQQGSIYTPGITAPSTKPTFASSTPNVSGGVVALTPGYEYVYTFYDGTRLTESGPSDPTLVLLPPGTTPSSITLSLGVSASTTVSARKVYRRKVGTEKWRLVGTVEDNTTTTFTDSSEVPLDDELDQRGGFFVTAEFPDITAVSAVEDRILGWRGSDTRLVWISESGDGERWRPFNFVATGGDVRSVLEHEGRAILLTDRTIEVVEGDWVTGSAGTLGVQHRFLEASRGTFGPFSACSTPFGVCYADPGGVHRLNIGFEAKDTSVTLSEEVHDVVQNAVDTAGSGVVMRWNHVSQEVWCLLSQALPGDTDTRNRVVLTFKPDGTWSILDLALSFVERVVDGTQGAKFIGCDYFGSIIELDVLDGDGIQGNESWLPATNTITSFSATALTVTKTGASFPTTLRSTRLVLRDVSTGEVDVVTILSASGDTLTVDRIPSWLAASDQFYVGGIHSFADTKEIDAGRPTSKRLSNVEVSFADCTVGRY